MNKLVGTARITDRKQNGKDSRKKIIKVLFKDNRLYSRLREELLEYILHCKCEEM